MAQKASKANLSDLLIATLTSARSTKRFKTILCERRLRKYKRGSIQVALFRLHTKGYVSHTDAGWSVTTKGKLHSKEIQLLDYMPSPFQTNCPAHTLLAFDIPEGSRVIRNWLRNQIKIFGYKMLQQSLWIGPGPLPPAFIKRLEDLKIRQHVKTFRITKSKA